MDGSLKHFAAAGAALVVGARADRAVQRKGRRVDAVRPSGRVDRQCRPERAGDLTVVGAAVAAQPDPSCDFRLWHLADVQPIASRGLVSAEKRTCLISVWNVR